MEYLVFILGVFIVNSAIGNTDIYGPKCLSCIGARDPSECKNATTCWASQKCYSERYTHAAGHLLYDFGCKIKEECELLSESRNRRLDITIDLCEECCDGDFCNVNTCANRTESFTTACYACEGQDTPDECHQLTRCNRGEICYAEKVITDSPSPRYTLGCLSQQVCSYLNKGTQPIGKRSTHLCQKCCSTSGCNKDVCVNNHATQTTNQVTVLQTTVTAPAQTVRLVDGDSDNTGRVEILYDGQWGTICDDLFDFIEAGVVCHMLGYPRVGAVVRVSAHFGEGTGPIWLDDVSCAGYETSILQCNHKPIGSSNCGHEEDVGVECYVPRCPTGFLRHNNFCYSFDNNTAVLSYDEAERECSKLGARLLYVDTLEEHSFILDVVHNITESSLVWMTGARYFNSQWTWQGINKPFTSAILQGPAKNLAGGPCLSYYYNRTNWIDVICNGAARNYICKKQLA